MTRTWLTRLLMMAPLAALASAGYAQTPATSGAPEAKPAAAQPAAPPPSPDAATPAPAKPAAINRPPMPAKPPAHATGGASGTHVAPRPAAIARPASHGVGGTSGTATPRPVAPAVVHPAPAKPALGAVPGATPAAKPKLPAPPGIRPAGAPAVPGPMGAAPAVKPAASHPVPPAAPRPMAAVPGGAAVAPPHPPVAPVAHPATGPLAKPGVLVPGAVAAAAAAPAAPGPKPAPELEQLKFLRGRWRCDGKQFATAMFGPEHVFTAVAEGKPMVDGFWDQYTYEERKSKDHHGLKVQGQWGWDQGAKHLVRVAVTNAGDWDSGSSPGLEGDKIVWTGEFSGLLGRMGYRHTFIKKSDKEWSHALELKDPTGKFTPINEVTCKR